MKTEAITNSIKTILFFGLISIGVDLIRKLIFIQLDLSKIFNLDFLLYEVVLEFVFLIITAFATHLLSKSIGIYNLGTSLLKASIFGVIYGIVSLISTRIISLSMGAGIGGSCSIPRSCFPACRQIGMKRSALTLDYQIFQIFLYLKIIKLRGCGFWVKVRNGA
jgi:hypothetical protein